MPQEFTLKFPQLQATKRMELVPSNKQEVASAIAPVVENLVESAGVKLSSEELADLRKAFIERGTITIAPSAAAASATISVEASSLNYSSKIAQRGTINQ